MGECLIVRRGTPPPPEYDSNHVAVWKLDETSGTTVADSVGSFIGTSANITIVDGFKGKALSFAGSTSAQIGFSARVIPIGAKTIRFKLKLANTIAGQQWLFQTRSDSSASHGEIINIQPSGKVKYGSWKNVLNTPRFEFESEHNVADNVWYDIRCVWDGTTNASGVKIYIKALDGANAGKFRNTSGSWVDYFTPNAVGTANLTETVVQARDLTIGKYNLTTSESYIGILDEIEISKIARTDM